KEDYDHLESMPKGNPGEMVQQQHVRYKFSEVQKAQAQVGDNNPPNKPTIPQLPHAEFSPERHHQVMEYLKLDPGIQRDKVIDEEFNNEAKYGPRNVHELVRRLLQEQINHNPTLFYRGKAFQN